MMIKHSEKSKEELLQEIAKLKQQLVEPRSIGNKFEENNEKHLSLFDNAHDLIQSIDNKGDILYVNKAWKEKFGYTKEITIKKLNLFQIIHPDSLEHCKDVFKKIFIEKNAQNIITNFVTKSGSKIIVEGNISPILKNGKIVSTLGFFRDVTERIKSEEKFKNITESSSDGIYQVDRHGKFTFINKSFTKIFGYEKNEILKKQYNKFLTSKDHPLGIKYFKDLINGATINSELKFKRKDGSRFTGYFSAIPIKKDKMINGFTGFVKDLSDFKYMEEEMSIINEINTKVNLGSPLNKILNDVSKSIAEIYDYQACIIYLYNSSRNYVTLTANSLSPKINKGIEKLIGMPTVGIKIPLFEGSGFTEVAKTKKSVVLSDAVKVMADYSDQKSYQIFAKTIVKLAGFKVGVRIPLVINKTLIGIMDIACKTAVTKGNIESLEKFAAQLALIISKVQNDEKLRESEEQFKTIVETTPSPMLLSNVDSGKIVFGNQSLAELVGIPLDKLIGQKTSDFYANPSDREEIVNELKEKGIVQNKELKVKHVDGSYTWIVLSMKVMLFKRVNTVFTSFANVSELKRAEEKAKESELRLNRFFNFAPIGIAITRMDGTFVKANIEFERFTGYTDEELKNLSYWDITPKEYDDAEQVQLNNLAKKSAYGPYEKEYIRKDGARVPVLSKGIVLKSGGKEFIWSVVEDLTFRKKKEAEVIYITKELNQFINTANALILGLDTEGNINEWNPEFEKVTGFKFDEVQGLNFITDFITNDYKGLTTNVLKDTLKGKETSNVEFSMLKKNHKKLMILLNYSPRYDSNNKNIGVLGVGQDITELVSYRTELETKIKERTKKLEIALKKEKELGELKSKFVTMTSHEFRTPLAAINFAAGSVKKYWGKLDVDSRIQKLDKIENQVNHMTRLLDDILFIGKTESDKTASNFELFNFNEFIEPIIDEVYILSKNTHQIKLINKNSEVTILIDQKLGRNIFINLLNNAIKFSPEKKEVILEVNSDDKMIQIKIIDFGIGIKKENLENIFTPFYREENVESIQGTGLGLSIVKDAVRLSKGTIKVESAIDKGTTFIINLLKK